MLIKLIKKFNLEAGKIFHYLNTRYYFYFYSLNFQSNETHNIVVKIFLGKIIYVKEMVKKRKAPLSKNISD